MWNKTTDYLSVCTWVQLIQDLIFSKSHSVEHAILYAEEDEITYANHIPLPQDLHLPSILDGEFLWLSLQMEEHQDQYFHVRLWSDPADITASLTILLANSEAPQKSNVKNSFNIKIHYFEYEKPSGHHSTNRSPITLHFHIPILRSENMQLIERG